MPQRDDLLVWIDLEMTSLVDPMVDSITQIGCLITDKELNIIAESEEITIHADPERFTVVPAEVQEMYKNNGLIPKILASTITESAAEDKILSFLQTYVKEGSSPLCGNSVYNDRMFLRFRIPKVNNYLHYRNIDVSTIKELARRWEPKLFADAEELKQIKTHHALQDIKDSLKELKLYRDRWLKS